MEQAEIVDAIAAIVRDEMDRIIHEHSLDTSDVAAAKEALKDKVRDVDLRIKEWRNESGVKNMNKANLPASVTEDRQLLSQLVSAEYTFRTLSGMADRLDELRPGCDKPAAKVFLAHTKILVKGFTTASYSPETIAAGNELLALFEKLLGVLSL